MRDTCKEFEAGIFLLSEQAEDRVVLIREHVKSCESCRLLLSEVEQFRRQVGLSARQPIVPANSASLTSQILERVRQQPRRSQRWVGMDAWLLSRFTRIPLTAASVFLVMVYVSQTYTTTVRPPKQERSLKVASVLLSSTAWRERLAKQVEKPGRPDACSSPFLSAERRLKCMSDYWTMIKPLYHE